jgi:hypothetical protein
MGIGIDFKFRESKTIIYIIGGGWEAAAKFVAMKGVADLDIKPINHPLVTAVVSLDGLLHFTPASSRIHSYLHEHIFPFSLN